MQTLCKTHDSGIRSDGRAEKGLELAEEAGAAIEEIVTAISEVEERAEEIAAASEQQSTTSEEIARSVQSISTAAQESAAGVTEVSDTAGRLERLSTELEETVQQFNIERGDGDARTPTTQPAGQPPAGNDVGGDGSALDGHNFGDGSPPSSSSA